MTVPEQAVEAIVREARARVLMDVDADDARAFLAVALPLVEVQQTDGLETYTHICANKMCPLGGKELTVIIDPAKHPGQPDLPPIDETRHSPEVVASLQHRALAPHPGQLQEGWQLVPVEPTAEMCNPPGITWHSSNDEIYRAMLAAPAAPLVAEPACPPSDSWYVAKIAEPGE